MDFIANINPSDKTGNDSARCRTQIGYLVPEFPGQTHIFFWREIAALQRMGVDTALISTRRPPKDIVSHTWSAEAMDVTRYLFPPGIRGLFSGGLELLRSGPRRWWRCAKTIQQIPDAGPGAKIRMVALVVLAARLAVIARQQQLKHIHVHSCADSSMLALFAHHLSGMQYSMTLHGPVSMYGCAQRLKWHHAAFGIAVSKRLRQEVLDVVGTDVEDRVEVAPMGVALDVFERSKPYQAAAADGPWRLVTCGRLHYGKGHQDLIDAIRILKDKGRSVHLTILGEGPARPDLEKKITHLELEDEVRLAGAVSEEQVRDHLEAAHLFALGSHDEAIGVATMEAMAMKLPVVVTDVGGVRELVREDVDGLLVPSQNSNVMASSIERILEEPDLAVRMGEAGAERVLRSFGSDASAGVIARRLGVGTPCPSLASHSTVLEGQAS